MAFIVMLSFLGHHPCFVAFDVLVINEKKLANVPLSERIKSMEKYEVPSWLYSTCSDKNKLILFELQFTCAGFVVFDAVLCMHEVS